MYVICTLYQIILVQYQLVVEDMPGGWAAVKEAAVLSIASVTTQSSLSEQVGPGGHQTLY